MEKPVILGVNTLLSKRHINNLTGCEKKYLNES